VHLYFATLTATLPHIRSGALRALAVLGRTRYEGLPEVPTVGEAVPGYEVDSFTGIGVRKGTPEGIIERLNREVNAGLADAGLGARFRELAAVPFVVGPSELDAHMAAAAQKWAEVIRAAHIRPE
jgi:tripartite-type tricarboxylate transporter receptor subunit TctC